MSWRSVGRRGAVHSANAGASGLGWLPLAVARNVSRSLTLERSAPAPASVGKSQLVAGCKLSRWPGARRFLSSAVSVMTVLGMTSGPLMRECTSYS